MEIPGLSYDELLVLFDLTHRWEDDGHVSDPIDAGEREALVNFTAALEPLVNEAFSPDFKEVVAAAKQRLVEGMTGIEPA